MKEKARTNCHALFICKQRRPFWTLNISSRHPSWVCALNVWLRYGSGTSAAYTQIVINQYRIRSDSIVCIVFFFFFGDRRRPACRTWLSRYQKKQQIALRRLSTHDLRMNGALAMNICCAEYERITNGRSLEKTASHVMRNAHNKHTHPL